MELVYFVGKKRVSNSRLKRRKERNGEQPTADSPERYVVGSGVNLGIRRTPK